MIAAKKTIDSGQLDNSLWFDCWKTEAGIIRDRFLSEGLQSSADYISNLISYFEAKPTRFKIK